MRKNQSGRPSKIKDVKKKVKELRDLNYSYSEIANMLGLKSRQLARWHDTNPVKKFSTEKSLTKNSQRV